jgi:hypothetical protein
MNKLKRLDRTGAGVLSKLAGWLMRRVPCVIATLEMRDTSFCFCILKKIIFFILNLFL